MAVNLKDEILYSVKKRTGYIAGYSYAQQA